MYIGQLVQKVEECAVVWCAGEGSKLAVGAEMRSFLYSLVLCLSVTALDELHKYYPGHCIFHSCLLKNRILIAAVI
jgi:hypothetical protein